MCRDIRQLAGRRDQPQRVVRGGRRTIDADESVVSAVFDPAQTARCVPGGQAASRSHVENGAVNGDIPNATSHAAEASWLE